MAEKLAGVSVISVLEMADATFLKVYPDYRKFLKYLVAGAIATTVDMTLLFLIISGSDLYYQIAGIISYHAGMVTSFYINRRFTFRNDYSKVHFQFASFALVAYSQLLLIQAAWFVLVDLIFRTGDDRLIMLSRAITVVIGFVYAFFVNKTLTFRIFK